jgi:hypothetical protein
MDPQYPLPYCANISRSQEPPFNSRVNNSSRTPYIIPTLGINTQGPIDAARVSIAQPSQSLPQDISMADLDTEGSDTDGVSGTKNISQRANKDIVGRTVLAASLVGLTVNENQRKEDLANAPNPLAGTSGTHSPALSRNEQALRRNSPHGQVGSQTPAAPTQAGPESVFQGKNLAAPTASASRLILSGLGVFDFSQDPKVTNEQKQQYFKACHFFNQLIEFNFVVIHNWALAKFKGKKTSIDIELIKWMVIEQTLLVFYASIQKNMDQLTISTQRESQYIRTLLFSIIKGMMIIDRHFLSAQRELNCLPQFQEYEKLPQLRECKIPSSTVYTLFIETLKKSPLSQHIQASSLEIKYDELFVNLNVPLAASMLLYLQNTRKTSGAQISQSAEQDYQQDFNVTTLAMACAAAYSIRKGPLPASGQPVNPDQLHPEIVQLKRFSIFIADSLLGSQKTKKILEQIQNPENILIKNQYDKEKEKTNLTFDDFRNTIKERTEANLRLAPQILQTYFKESDPKALADKLRPNFQTKKLQNLTDLEVFISYFRYLMQVFFIPNK